MVECGLPMFECVHDAGAQVTADLFDHRAPKIAAYDVATEREGQSGLSEPPFAGVDPELETVIGVGELAFVDQQSEVDFAPLHGAFDLVERCHDRFEIRLPESKGQIGRRQQAGNRDPLSSGSGARVGWLVVLADQSRPVTVSHG